MGGGSEGTRRFYCAMRNLCDRVAERELVDKFGNLTRTYGTTTLTDSETQTL